MSTRLLPVWKIRPGVSVLDSDHALVVSHVIRETGETVRLTFRSFRTGEDCFAVLPRDLLLAVHDPAVTPMTATVQASEAADRLRKIIRPGDLIYTQTSRSRNGRPCVDLFIPDGPTIRRITDLVSDALAAPQNRDWRIIGREPRDLVDDLSTVLHGDPDFFGWRAL